MRSAFSCSSSSLTCRCRRAYVHSYISWLYRPVSGTFGASGNRFWFIVCCICLIWRL